MIYSVDRTKQRSQAEIIRLFGKYRARNLGFSSGMVVALQQSGEKGANTARKTDGKRKRERLKGKKGEKGRRVEGKKER